MLNVIAENEKSSLILKVEKTKNTDYSKHKLPAIVVFTYHVANVGYTELITGATWKLPLEKQLSSLSIQNVKETVFFVIVLL